MAYFNLGVDLLRQAVRYMYPREDFTPFFNEAATYKTIVNISCMAELNPERGRQAEAKDLNHSARQQPP